MRRFLFIALIPLALQADTRTVVPGGAGPNRLDPDAALLSRAQPLRYAGGKTFTGGLEDLRLRDQAGGEVPYLIIPPQTSTGQWTSAHILPVVATKTTSGFEADLGRLRDVDRLRIEGVPAPFMKRLTLEGSGDRTHYALLAADATIFDLPEEKLQNLEVAFDPGQYRYLRVTWNDRASAVVRHVGPVSARIHNATAPEESAVIAIPYRKVASEPGKSRYRLQLPGPHLPIAAIELSVANQNVLRDATVVESRLSGSELLPVDLGAAVLRKTSREGATASSMAVPTSFPEGADLDLVVDDGNNPPMTIEAVTARFAPLPWIYFEAADTTPLGATYGDPTLRAPRYDLEAKRKDIGRITPLRATWGAAAGRAITAREPSDVVLRGALLNRSNFRFSRRIPSAPAGAARLLLDAEVLAHSADVADVRIVNSKNEQIPFLVERRSDPLIVDLKIPQRTTEERKSTYVLQLPYDTLPAHTRIVFTTSARVFSREVELRRDDDEAARNRRPIVLASTTWSSRDPDHDPPALTFDVALSGMRSLSLVVDEGDNAPLPITSAQLLVPSVALRFYDPGTPLELLYGNPGATAPRYDLELLASRVFAQPARDITLTPPRATQPERTPGALKFFWIAIALVVVVLLATLARLITGRAATQSS